MKIFLVFISLFTINLFSKEIKADGYYRYVQVLAIRDFSRAKKVMNKLDSLGYSYLVRDSIKKKEQYFRVVVGPFSKNSIKKEQKKLQKLLHIRSSFILTYETEPSTTVNLENPYKFKSQKSKKKSIKKVKKIVVKKHIKRDEYKKRIDKIVELSFDKEHFIKNKSFVCKELNNLVENNYPPAILLLASNYIKGDECVKQDLKKAIKYLKGMQKEKENLPKNLSKFSKELLAETYLKTLDTDNFIFAKKIFENLLLDETNSNKYTIYLFKRLAYIEYSLKEYKYMNLWLSEAAKLGDVESQLNLGKNYIKGLGYKQNAIKAKYWLEKCENTNSECAENLANIYMNLYLDTAPNLDKAFSYFEKASSLGSLSSKRLLEKKDEIIEFYSLMKSDEIQHKLVREYLYKRTKNININNIFITNIEQHEKDYNVFTSFTLDDVEKVAKLVFQKNKHNYWVVKEFKISDSILSLK